MPNKTILISIRKSSCPCCGAYPSNDTFLSITEPIFNDGTENNTDPHYSFSETHKCNVCDTVYTFESGT